MPHLKRSRRIQVRQVSNGVCHLCGWPIDFLARPPHPMAFTIDHVIPRIKGGTNALSNLKAAHYICNMVRSSDEIERFRAKLRRSSVKYQSKKINIHATMLHYSFEGIV